MIYSIYFDVFMTTSELFDLDASASLHLQLLASPLLWQHPLVSSDDLMIVDGVRARATLLDLIERPHYLEVLDQRLILGYCGQRRRVMLLVAHDDVTH